MVFGLNSKMCLFSKVAQQLDFTLQLKIKPCLHGGDHFFGEFKDIARRGAGIGDNDIGVLFE